ncbi:MAG: phosphatidylglycerol lysyltransferase domain-containing protein [Nitrospiraceae bacterium]
MKPESQTSRSRLVQIAPLPQLVPSRVCLSCDVCCRFPDPDSSLRPYFTGEEIRRAIARGVAPAQFPELNGCQVSVVPSPVSDGYLCPAFDPATSHCRIYDVRPLDCQIYPFVVMWNADRTQVVLGWDSKCPFLREGKGDEAGVVAYADRIAGLLEQDGTLETVAKNPRFIGRFQDDVVLLRPLPGLTERLGAGPQANSQADGPTSRASIATAVREGADAPTEQTPLVLHPLTLGDRPRFARAFASVETPLAAYAFAPHFVWRALFSYSWAELDGHLSLFAEYADGVYMPLPPLPLPAGRSQDGSPSSMTPRLSPAALAACFAFMRERNTGSAVSRIENVPEKLRPTLQALGYRVVPKDSDYLYRSRDLATLAGDRYKSQRAACNRFERDTRYRCEPYQDAHREASLALFEEWAAQKETEGLDAGARHMLRDSASAHREALTHHRALGLAGRVVRVDGAIRAYTLGYERSSSVFCILLEVADRRIPGLAQFLFRESCREEAGRGFEFINTMDDSGIPSLARSKQAYHPVRMLPNYIAT